MHFVMDIAIDVSSAGLSMTVPMGLEGDFQAPDRFRETVSISLGALNVEFETITIGEDAYVMNPETGEWEIDTEETVPFGGPTQLLETDLSVIQDLVLVGLEDLNGVEVYRLSGGLPAESLGDEGVAGALKVEYWVGTADSLLRRITIDGELDVEEGEGLLFGGGDAGSMTLSMTIEFSDFGKPVAIVAPEVSVATNPGAEADEENVSASSSPVALTGLIPRSVLFGLPDRTDVRLSLDGTWISYRAPLCGEAFCFMNVWVAPIDDIALAGPVTQDMEDGIGSYLWAFTSEHILYRQDTDGDENWRIYSVDLANGQTKLLTPAERVQARFQEGSPKFPQEIIVALNDRDPEHHDLHRVDIATGERTLVQLNEGFSGFVTDDDFVVRLAERVTPNGGGELLKPVASGGWEPFIEIAPEDALTTSPYGFDKSGRVLYMEDSRGRDTSALTAVDLASGDTTVIAANPRADLDHAMFHPTEKQVQAVAFTYERKQWQVVDQALAEDFAYLRTVDDGDFDIVSRTLDDGRWIVEYLSDNAPLRYYLYDRGERRAKFLFADKPGLEALPLVRMHPEIIESRDGLELVGYLTLPPQTDPDGDARPDAPLPMVLSVHGGPWSRDSWGYDSEHQWLANRGYAVLSVNFRGSTGFGKALVNAGNNEWGGRMLDDLIDAVNWAVEERVADPERVAIRGGSYGGYAVLAGLTFEPETFACGVDFAGPSNLVTFLNTIPPYWAPQIEMFAARVGDHRTDAGRVFLGERSPINFVDQINRPLLIGQGANDPRVNRAEAEQIVQAMQERGIPVTYVVYPDEGHGFSSAANARSFNAVTETFLAGCLGGRSEPIVGALGGSSITVPVGAEHVIGLSEALSPNALALYESDDQPFSIQYPAAWTEAPPDPDVTAIFFGGQDALLLITEEDLAALGIGESTLRDYTDVLVSSMTGDGSVLVSSRKQFETSQGLDAEVLELSVEDGFRAKRLIYLHEGTVGFSATYFAAEAQFDELRAMIEHSFGTFRVEERVPAP